jgi:hypothetical protein
MPGWRTTSSSSAGVGAAVAGNQLYVYEATYPGMPPARIADFRLAGGGYTASSFSIVGNDVIHYTRPASGWANPDNE